VNDKAFIHEQARKDLDISLPLKKQVESKLIQLQEKVGVFPDIT